MIGLTDLLLFLSKKNMEREKDPNNSGQTGQTALPLNKPAKTANIRLNSEACDICRGKILKIKHRECFESLNDPGKVCPRCQEMLCDECFSLSFCYDLCAACSEMICRKCSRKCESLDDNFCKSCLGKLCSRCTYTLRTWKHPGIKKHMEKLEITLSDDSDYSSDDSESSENPDDPHGKNATAQYREHLKNKLKKKQEKK